MSVRHHIKVSFDVIKGGGQLHQFFTPIEPSDLDAHANELTVDSFGSEPL